MDGFVEEAFASALGVLAVPGILCDVGDQARIENALPIVRRIKATIKVEISASQVQPNLFGHLLQGLQTLSATAPCRLIDGSHREWRQHIAMIVGYGETFSPFWCL